MRSGVIRCALLLGLAGPAVAGPTYTPDQFALASPAMRLFALGQDGLGPEEVPFARAELTAQGFGAPAPAVVASDFRWSPQLTYDPNTNGGYATSSFDLGGFAFSVDPDYRARAGMMAGLRGQGYATFALGGAFAADAFADVRYLHATTGGDAKSNAFVGGCLRQGLSARTTLRECISTAASQNSLGFSRTSGTEIGLGHGFGMGSYLMEAGGFTRRERLAQDSYQWQGGGSMTVVAPSGLRLDMGVAVGQPVSEEIAMRHRLSIGVIRHLWGEWTRVQLITERRAGGTFMGQARHERVISARLARDITLPLWKPVQGEVSISWDIITARQDVLSQHSVMAEMTVRLP